MSETNPRATLSVAIITFNEEENIGRTLASVKQIADEIIVVDSHSTDRTIEIAKEFGATVFIEEWKGFAAQKNSALDKCTCDWILSLDADEEVSAELKEALADVLDSAGRWHIITNDAAAHKFTKEDAWEDYKWNFQLQGKQPKIVAGAFVNRQNHFLGKWIRHGGFYPDSKLRLIQKFSGRFADRSVHEDIEVTGPVGLVRHDLIHHQYPSLASYIEHMNRYSSLGAEMVVEKHGRAAFNVINIVVRPIATFLYNYVFRLGFLDGQEGLLLHLYHSVYVSWKYAKAWEMGRQPSAISRQQEIKPEK